MAVLNHSHQTRLAAMREATWKLNLSHIVFADRGWGAPFSRWGLRVINDITLIWVVILIAVGGSSSGVYGGLTSLVTPVPAVDSSEVGLGICGDQSPKDRRCE